MLSSFFDAKQSLGSIKGNLTLRVELRESTRIEHQALDHSLSTLDLGRAADYRTFLHIQLTALDALAGIWAAADDADFEALRQRLADDLRQESFPEPARSSAALESRAAQWGIAYVIRGSRLGSKLLSARVAAGFSKHYFDYAPALTWPQFLLELERASIGFDVTARQQVVAGAKLAFATYATAAAARNGNS